MLRVLALASLMVLPLAPAPVSAQTAWKTITSKEGQFTVEMRKRASCVSEPPA